MLSLRADIQLSYKLLGAKDPELLDHFQEIGIDLSLLVVESYLTIFTNTCHPDITDIIIDHFFINGPTALLKAMILLLSYLRETLLQINNFGRNRFKTEVIYFYI